ncbi:diaminobutyrate acetyltransferase [Pseudonocardia benzenivorans]|jgi:L-2,4-diaminobutyric acid acetyltransferase|uniref:L-2,4-diaminobutyric acid acetyltransferase n=2 Tax=Pseudonocardia TaxID=1847 RepID=F4D1P1_PSEUX|nr:diaminobutyrate acetyltransferase [Pseudonocardia dioxanivorans]AEA27951.1 L-2,4-diaminobutyric acid acetyltransferase [Pseudonocardia dioxanivorans CB1190]GJF05309.1 L-2,4-diaminobutyric acid acetyltransferase [Pseudonocardia sp. D17]
MLARDEDTDHPASPPPVVVISAPTVDDGVECSRLAAESKVLDLNSRYAYLLWCRDFGATSVVARLGHEDNPPIGFVTGYRRPDAPSTLVVWQVAVDAEARGLGVAGRMLDALAERVPDIDHLETTITPDNEASERLFTAFAERRGAPVARTELFSADQLGADHEPEILHRIGPFAA